MTLWKRLFPSTSAPQARERLQILLSHERQVLGGGDLLARLREDILAVVAKHVPCEQDNVKVRLERGTPMSILEIEVEVRGDVGLAASRAA
ncbi:MULTISPECIES: cell division topological specificity factor MinE [Ancylobacter]|uniref:Cell division topological specificity factor n=1 Tax=Ancylobacter vacuolatus TaxID=223389 RepID=A0ABU0DGZ5_9HYPH|nr:MULTISPECIES: cell division topological specificity factor MinE [Ancylobacter]MDQ0347689.1 cell division topological specificity factor [Ancylobacter vacuolatus]